MHHGISLVGGSQHKSHYAASCAEAVRADWCKFYFAKNKSGEADSVPIQYIT
jgi:hypothetical protein